MVSLWVIAQPVCSRVAVPLGAPSPRSSQRSAAALVLPGTATSATARFCSGAGGAGSAGRAGTSLARQIEEQEALLEKEAERLRMLQEVLEKEAGRLLMVEEALTKEGVPDTSPRWQILAADKQILAAKEQRLAAKEQDLAVDKQGLAADKQRFAEKEAAGVAIVLLACCARTLHSRRRASCPRDPPLIIISPASVLQLGIGSASRSTR